MLDQVLLRAPDAGVQGGQRLQQPEPRFLQQVIGVLAAERVFARLDGDSEPERTYVVPTTLIVRGSGEIPPRA